MEKSAFGYAKELQDEIGIYIVCNDMSLLNAINVLMRKRGLVAVSDTAGRHHYIIDARKNPMIAARRMEQLIFSDESKIANILDKFGYNIADLDEAISQILEYHNFDRTLNGTKLIRRLLKSFIQSSETASFKKLYSDVGKKYKMTYQQVERNIRYAVQKSDLWELGIKNSKIFMRLTEEVLDLL